MPSQPQPPQHLDCPGAEFSRDDPLEQRLLADGVQWRTHSAPPLAPFSQRMNAALREEQHMIKAEERSMAERVVTRTSPLAAHPPRGRRPGVWSTLVAVAASVAIVATLAWVFQALPNSCVARPAATPTPNFAAHVTHARGHWADFVQYTAIPTRQF